MVVQFVTVLLLLIQAVLGGEGKKLMGYNVNLVLFLSFAASC